VKAIDAWSEKSAMKVLPIRLWWGVVSTARDNRKALEAKVAPLEQDIAKLKAHPLQKWAGIHVSGISCRFSARMCSGISTLSASGRRPGPSGSTLGKLSPIGTRTKARGRPSTEGGAARTGHLLSPRVVVSAHRQTSRATESSEHESLANSTARRMARSVRKRSRNGGRLLQTQPTARAASG
jgi:hypothetical protein